MSIKNKIGSFINGACMVAAPIAGYKAFSLIHPADVLLAFVTAALFVHLWLFAVVDILETLDGIFKSWGAE